MILQDASFHAYYGGIESILGAELEVIEAILVC